MMAGDSPDQFWSTLNLGMLADVAVQKTKCCSLGITVESQQSQNIPKMPFVGTPLPAVSQQTHMQTNNIQLSSSLIEVGNLNSSFVPTIPVVNREINAPPSTIINPSLLYSQDPNLSTVIFNNNSSAEINLDIQMQNQSTSEKGDMQTYYSENQHLTQININTSRKSMISSEKLTLEQIQSLSDKLLIEMFSELTCDEIRKNYSYKCFLIPDKCCQSFKSFGNEARARIEMKTHLQSHIKDLMSEASESTDKTSSFTAEPLHVRRKRLKDLNSKSVRGRKKTKSSGTKIKKDVSSKTSYEVKSSLPKGKSSKSIHRKASTTVQSENSRSLSFSSEFGDFLVSRSSQNHSIDSHYGEKTSETFDSSHLQRRPRKKDKEKKVHSSSILSDYSVNWDTDFKHVLIDSSNVYDFDASYCSPNSNLHINHDHDYTSITLGNTFVKREKDKATKTKKQPIHHFQDPALLLPSSPFPNVYVPLLPQASEVQQVHTSPKVIIHNRSPFITQNILKRNPKLNQGFFPVSSKEVHPIEGFGKSECEEDSESIFSDSFLFDDHQVNEEPKVEIAKDISRDKVTPAFNMDDLETDCPPSLQSVEKELALKYIRALRTNKKERSPLICQICKNKSFTAQATLLYHYRSHAGIKPFSCTVCEATFTRQHSLKYHMLIHYDKSRFVCLDCGRNFRHPSHFKEHLRRHTGETPYECTDCNLRFKTRNTYKRHLKTRHRKILTINSSFI